jgi:hypothetical protein
MEPLSALLLTFGIATLLASWVQLLITSSNEDFTWGLCTVFLPAVSYFYSLFRLDVAKDALALAVIGWILVGLALI